MVKQFFKGLSIAIIFCTLITFHVYTNDGHKMITSSVSVEAVESLGEIVYIPDQILEAEIRSYLNKPTDDITRADMETILSLYISNPNAPGVEDLTGLEYASNITSLSLWYNDIKDISPLANLTTLTNLNLKYNNITDISPLANLTNLKYLDLFGNKSYCSNTYQEILISDISALSNLTELEGRLSLGITDIEDISPLENLTKLSGLLIYRSKVNDISPLANLVNMHEIFFNGSNFTDISPLTNLTKLRTLHLSSSKVTDFSPIENLPNLKELSLSNNQIRDIGFIKNLTTLTELSLSSNRIRDISPLESLTNLWGLYLGNNEIRDLNPLANLHKLDTLYINNNFVDDISMLSGPNLFKFHAEGNRLSDIGVTAGMNRLRYLYVYDNYLDITAGSETMILIDQLISNGVQVSYGRQDEPVILTVKFDLNGAPGQVPATQSVPYGGRVIRPPDPVRPGYYFGGWYTNSSGTGMEEFHYLNNYRGWPVKGDLTLYAKWVMPYSIPFGFINTTNHFFNSKPHQYNIFNDHHNILIEGRTYAERQKVRDAINEEWSGACYGMSNAMVLFNEYKLDSNFFQPGTITHEYLNKPKDRLKVRSLIHYYQLSQVLSEIQDLKYHQAFLGQPELYHQQLINEVKGEKSIVIGFFYNLGDEDRITGHAVVSYDYLEQSDGSHKISIYDPNYDRNNSQYIEPYLLINANYIGVSYYDPHGDSHQVIITAYHDSSLFDEINLQQRLMKRRGYQTAYSSSELMSAYSIETYSYIALTTNYNNFVISDDQGREAVVNGMDITGDLEISTPASYVSPGIDLIRNTYYLKNQNTYTVQPLDVIDLYDTALNYHIVDGSYMTAKTAGPALLEFQPNGVVKVDSDKVTSIDISTTINTATTPWYTVSVEANLTDLMLTPAPDNNVISSVETLGAIEVVVYNDHNKIPLSINTTETSVVVKNTASDNSGLSMQNTNGESVNSNLTVTNQVDDVLASTPLVYSANFRTYGGSPVNNQSGLPYGSLVNEPEDPIFPGFIFAGWYKDAECTDGFEWDFGVDTIIKDTTIHAKWIEDKSYTHVVRFIAEDHDDVIFFVFDEDSIEVIPEVPEKLGYIGRWSISEFTSIKKDLYVFADYEPDPEQYVINVSCYPVDSGAVSGGGIYRHGTEVTVAAIANTGFDFVNWTEDSVVVSTEAEYTFEAEAARDLVANFKAYSGIINLTIEPEGARLVGAAWSIDGGVSWHSSGTELELAIGSYNVVYKTIDGWQKPANTAHVVEKDQMVFHTAYYIVRSYDVNVVKEPEHGGTITGDGQYEYGSIATLNAEAADGYKFLRWMENGEVVSTDATYSFEVTASLYLHAIFGFDYPFAGGSGSAGDPFLIETAEHLNLVRDYSFYHFRQIADIDLGVAPWNEGDGWLPISTDNFFNGSYDGQGFLISNLYINRADTDDVGLFSRVGFGRLTDIHLREIEVTGQDFVGGLAGSNQGDMHACTVTGSVSGGNFVGGLAGMSYEGLIEESDTAGIVSGIANVGGLVGSVDEPEGEVRASSADSIVTAVGVAGGLLGANYGRIIDCSAEGPVNGAGADTGDWNLGGLVGWNEGEISGSSASGNVRGIYYVGGLVGRNNSNIYSSHATGNVNGEYYNGGLVGANFTGYLFDSYATGDVTGLYYVGGLTGYSSGVIAYAYAEGNINGLELVGGLVGRQADYLTILAGLHDEGDGGLTQIFAPNSYNGNKHEDYHLPWESPLIGLLHPGEDVQAEMSPFDGYWVFLRGEEMVYSTPVGHQ